VNTDLDSLISATTFLLPMQYASLFSCKSALPISIWLLRPSSNFVVKLTVLKDKTFRYFHVKTTWS